MQPGPGLPRRLFGLWQCPQQLRRFGLCRFEFVAGCVQFGLWQRRCIPVRQTAHLLMQALLPGLQLLQVFLPVAAMGVLDLPGLLGLCQGFLQLTVAALTITEIRFSQR